MTDDDKAYRVAITTVFGKNVRQYVFFFLLPQMHFCFCPFIYLFPFSFFVITFRSPEGNVFFQENFAALKIPLSPFASFLELYVSLESENQKS